MILLDTNVVSEPLYPVPSPNVMAWINAQDIETLYMPSVVLAEWLTGTELLPQGKRRSGMELLIQDFMIEVIGPRILQFDKETAKVHARFMANTASRGITVGFADCQIAAIAFVHNLTVATRDVAPFLQMGVPVINPWD